MLFYSGVPPLVLRRVLEILTYLATNHSGVASLLFHYEGSNIPEISHINHSEGKNGKGKDKIIGVEGHLSNTASSQKEDVPLILLLRLLSEPLFLRSIAHLEQVCILMSKYFHVKGAAFRIQFLLICLSVFVRWKVMGLLQVVIYAAASKVDIESNTEETAPPTEIASGNETTSDIQKDPHVMGVESSQPDQSTSSLNSKSDGQRSIRTRDIFLMMPQSDLRNLCGLLGHEGYCYYNLIVLYFCC